MKFSETYQKEKQHLKTILLSFKIIPNIFHKHFTVEEKLLKFKGFQEKLSNVSPKEESILSQNFCNKTKFFKVNIKVSSKFKSLLRKLL